MKLIYVIANIVFICISCGSADDTVSDDQDAAQLQGIIDSNSHIKIHENDTIELSNSAHKIQTQQCKSFGNRRIIEVTFPNRWQYQVYDSLMMPTSTNSEFEEVVRDLSFLNNTNNSSPGEMEVTFKGSRNEKEFVPYYDNAISHAFYDSLSLNVSKQYIFSCNAKDAYRILFTKHNFKAERSYRFFGAIGYDIIDMVTIDKENEIIDGLYVYYNAYHRYSASIKLFYLDHNSIIHIKYFWNGDEYRKYFRYEKWQIKPNGKIVRYYDSNGLFVNDEEHGMVVNKMREDVWIEMKPNGFVNARTYLEAKFTKGEPIGEWKYYRLLYDSDDQG